MCTNNIWHEGYNDGFNGLEPLNREDADMNDTQYRDYRDGYGMGFDEGGHETWEAAGHQQPNEDNASTATMNKSAASIDSTDLQTILRNAQQLIDAGNTTGIAIMLKARIDSEGNGIIEATGTRNGTTLDIEPYFHVEHDGDGYVLTDRCRDGQALYSDTHATLYDVADSIAAETLDQAQAVFDIHDFEQQPCELESY